ncbi:MAG: TolC family protein, partial [Vicinamibacterales bacterium]
DRERAGNRRDAGLVTDADVLQLDVHLARTREQQIRAEADEEIARAQLNQAMGEPLDTVFSLDPRPAAVGPASVDVPALEAEAVRNRPDVKMAMLQEQLAQQAVETARAAFLPQVAAQGGWELNGGTWSTRASGWVVGAVARINVFHGFADQARLSEAREQETRRALERQKAETAVRLDVRIAAARLNAARASEAVGRAAADQAREGQRIVRDRYEAGVTDVSSLLRAAEAVSQAEAQEIAAQVDVLVAAAGLERAAGRP